MSVIEALNAARPFVQHARDTAVSSDYREECQHRLDLIDRALSTPQPGVMEADPRKALADLIASRLLGVPADEQDVVLEDHDWRLIISALCFAPASEESFQPTHRHVKSGRLERVIGEAEAQVSFNTVTPHRGRNARYLHEGDTLIVYQGADDKLWCRAPSEFNDGRFVEIGTEEQP